MNRVVEATDTPKQSAPLHLRQPKVAYVVPQTTSLSSLHCLANFNVVKPGFHFRPWLQTYGPFYKVVSMSLLRLPIAAFPQAMTSSPTRLWGSSLTTPRAEALDLIGPAPLRWVPTHANVSEVQKGL